MERSDLAKLLTEFLVPLGFKRKGHWWARNRDEINTLVDLQKSQFGNFYYVNYGFVIKGLSLDGLKTHVDGRIGGKNREEQTRLTQLLDLENEIPDETRKAELKRILRRRLIPKIEPIKTEADVLEMVKKLPTLNLVPLAVRRYFGLETES